MIIIHFKMSGKIILNNQLPIFFLKVVVAQEILKKPMENSSWIHITLMWYFATIPVSQIFKFQNFKNNFKLFPLLSLMSVTTLPYRIVEFRTEFHLLEFFTLKIILLYPLPPPILRNHQKSPPPPHPPLLISLKKSRN